MTDLKYFQRLINGFGHEYMERVNNSDCLVHQHIIADLNNLISKSKQAGFEFKIASGFRDFDRQLLIWNEKALGKRKLLDDYGNELNYKKLSRDQILSSILRWSAIPGLSRHHWGTEIDVYDQSSLPQNYKLQLTPDEVCDNGILGNFHCWLDEQIQIFNFYRPYEKDLGGIAPERWHLSYAPLSKEINSYLTIDLAIKIINKSPIEFKDLLLSKIDEIYHNYIKVI